MKVSELIAALAAMQPDAQVNVDIDEEFIPVALVRESQPAGLAILGCGVALAEHDSAADAPEAAEGLAGRLIDAWCADKGKQIPWAKAVQIVAIVTKQSDGERDRLLRLGDEDGSCGMCGRSADGAGLLASLREILPLAESQQDARSEGGSAAEREAKLAEARELIAKHEPKKEQSK